DAPPAAVVAAPRRLRHEDRRFAPTPALVLLLEQQQTDLGVGAPLAGRLEQVLGHADDGPEVRRIPDELDDVPVALARDQALGEDDADPAARLHQRQEALDEEDLR